MEEQVQTDDPVPIQVETADLKTAEEKENILQKTSTSCLVVKLKSFCKDKYVREELERVVDQTNRLSYEGYQLLNFHARRLLENKKPVSNVLNQTLLRNILVAVTGNPISGVDTQAEEKARTTCAELRKEIESLGNQQGLLRVERRKERKMAKELEQKLEDPEPTVDRASALKNNLDILIGLLKEVEEDIKTVAASLKSCTQQWNNLQCKSDLRDLQDSVDLWWKKRLPLAKKVPLPDMTGLSHFTSHGFCSYARCVQKSRSVGICRPSLALHLRKISGSL